MGHRLLAPAIVATATAVVSALVGAGPVSAQPAPSDPVSHRTYQAKGFTGSTQIEVPPGGTATVTSGDLDKKTTSVKVEVSASPEDQAYENLVFTLAQAPTPGKRLLVCLMVVQLGQTYLDHEEIERLDFTEESTTRALLALLSCMRIAQLVAEIQAEGPPARSTVAAPPTCKTRPSGVTAQTTKVESGYQMTVAGDLEPATKAAALKMTCKRKGQKLTFSIRPKAKGKSLRSVIGKNLGLDIASPSDAEEGTTVKVAFKKG